MEELIFSPGAFPESYLQTTAQYILSTQKANGCIPWFNDGKADPWDHTEAAMGLSITGHWQAAEKAYAWLAEQQLQDGSWYANYINNEPMDCEKRETNFVAYIATGVWHHYLVTKDLSFLEKYFPCVQNAINFVLRYQSPSGEIYWQVHADNTPMKDALITGCASIYKSIECAILAAKVLQLEHTDWHLAYHKLGNTLRNHPECFDRTWESKARYSMDWFYPILAGVYDKKDARKRIDQRWDKFVRNGLGCLCVSDEPWVTIAESCELTLALLHAGETHKAIKVYGWLHRWRDSDGGFWTGYQYAENTVWPKEKTTWTAGAILLAADALTQHTGAANLFLHSELSQSLSKTVASNYEATTEFA